MKRYNSRWGKLMDECKSELRWQWFKYYMTLLLIVVGIVVIFIVV